MSRMSEIIIEIQEEIEKGELSFHQIAEKFEVPVGWVDEAARELTEMYGDEFETDDSYALASAGFGTDEDYGSFGDEW
jgi:Mn-dependent DtxR family transcriptional regulator